jgi:hypothetical protein
MKFCKDCKWFALTEPKTITHPVSKEVYEDEVFVFKCKSPNRPQDMVMGFPKDMTAEHCRNLAVTGCGEYARWFEPKVFEPTSVEDADLDDLSKIPFGK